MSAKLTPKLGELLVEGGALTPAELAQALSQLRGRLGNFLRSYGIVSAREVAQALATQHGVPLVYFDSAPPETQLFSPRELPMYLRHRFVPYRHRGGALTLATPEPSEVLRDFAQTYYRMPVNFVVTPARDLNQYFMSRAATATIRRSTLGLRRRYHDLVADCMLVGHQRRGFALLFLLLASGFYLAPHGMWFASLIACNLFYAVTLLVKFAFYRNGCLAARDEASAEATLAEKAAALSEVGLPTYSILVPMYRESKAVMARLIANLNALDYPKEKLDIKLIVERDDTATIEALKSLRPPETMEIIAVPPSQPRTKPKACNVALEQVRGEYLVIYDAEDAPAPDQLRRAVVMYRDGPEKLACVQASLNYYNREENLLTQLFSIEYSSLFRLLLPALARLKFPIPLGGTSNHLKVEVLREAGGWDAFNVTEDCDLGVRLHYLGYETRNLPSLTLEEAPITLGAWLKQRTRWIKGYIQTWLVYTRDAAELKRRLGGKAYYGFQFFVGAPALTFLFAPIFWMIFAVSLAGLMPIALPGWMVLLCAFSFVGGVLSHWLFARKVIEVEGWYHLRGAFFLYPFYWLLHSIAAARALWQLITAPHYWDKTTHGVSRAFEQAR